MPASFLPCRWDPLQNGTVTNFPYKPRAHIQPSDADCSQHLLPEERTLQPQPAEGAVSSTVDALPHPLSSSVTRLGTGVKGTCVAGPAADPGLWEDRIPPARDGGHTLSGRRQGWALHGVIWAPALMRIRGSAGVLPLLPPSPSQTRSFHLHTHPTLRALTPRQAAGLSFLAGSVASALSGAKPSPQQRLQAPPHPHPLAPLDFPAHSCSSLVIRTWQKY